MKPNLQMFALTLWTVTTVVLTQSIPSERPRARPPSDLTGWADWERAEEIFSRVPVPPSPPLSPEEAQKTFRVAPGYRLELVAAEPMVANPIFMEFDPDGRIWVVEYRGYMRDLEGRGEGDPICRIVVLEDTTGDGRADRSTVFLDGLVMPRTLAFVEGGVLVAEPPHLWYCRDTDGDLKADSKELVGSYGRAGNPQHTANGLAYGLDNWLHSADWERRHRFENGVVIEEAVLYRGQFGVSFDEFGRFVTCRESSPAEMDFIPEEYLRRHPALVRSWQRSSNSARFGIAVPIGRAANECFPIRPTPGITLGGLELRDDGTLRTYTIVAGTGVYLGDQFPEDAYGNIFVPEAGGHLIGRLRVHGGVAPRVERFYPEGQEILASTDERFRPMSVRTGPDGALYFADMYKGVIEHVIFMAPYIAEQMLERGLTEGNDRGRIYRLVSTEKPFQPVRPGLGEAPAETLVEHLGHANGWWRLTAQRLLVERRAVSVAPMLEELARAGRASVANHAARLHALWTLEGLGALSWETATAASADPHEFVRAAALRLCERKLAAVEGQPDDMRSAQFLERLRETLGDGSEVVRLQTALCLGALPEPGADAAMARMLDENDSALIRTAILSGLRGREHRFLDRLLGGESRWRESSEPRSRFLSEFAELVMDGRDPSLIGKVLTLAVDADGVADWRGQALLAGLLEAVPADVSGVQPIALEEEPRVIPRLLTSGNRVARDQGWRLAELFTWPGHLGSKRARDRGGPLSPGQEMLFSEGRDLFTQLCAPCHQPHGGGLANVAPPLNGTSWVAGPPDRLVRLLLHGFYGPIEIAGTEWNHHMPGFSEGGLTDDRSVAAVLTYVRRAWDNNADAVDPALVARARAETAGRRFPWTTAELVELTEGMSAEAVQPELIRPDANGELILPARLAVCFGEQLGYRPALDIVAPWRREHDIATWRVEVPVAADYDVFITLAADDASTGDEFLVESEVGGVRGHVPATGGYDRFLEVRVGTLPLRAGVNRLLVRPAGKLRAELADVRGLRLGPVAKPDAGVVMSAQRPETGWRQLSGIYPHLALFNDEAECGTGGVVPFGGRLWVVTYAPHQPRGSTDKLYEITPDLRQIVRSESIGGTPANRMIHRESNQLFIGPYAIGADGTVRAIPYETMFGRPTGNARHLTDPANKIYYATMEEGIYEVDVRTLEVRELWRDEQLAGGRKSNLPGYHGKGLYSGQGVLVYANNGEHGVEAQRRPEVASGTLAEWDGSEAAWKVVRRNQFTEVTGPGGIMGNANPDEDPVWTIGWDHRSLIVMCRHAGEWQAWRLPKGSHSYDGAHGWNTEWPRIRDIGEDNLLMTMHGTFWCFPPTFKPAQASGIRPRSNYLKVIGDFCRWNDRVVFGCDDTARNEFLNKRKAKGDIAQPQSQSNLWFVEPATLDDLGPAIGRGAVWLNEPVKADAWSDAYLFEGYDLRGAHLNHNESTAVAFYFEVDAAGDGKWQPLTCARVGPGRSVFLTFRSTYRGEWVRVRTSRDCARVSAVFSYRNRDVRGVDADSIFAGLADAKDLDATGGLVRALNDGSRSLGFAARAANGAALGYYELDESLELKRKDDVAALRDMEECTAIPMGVLSSDAASVLFTDDDGRRWRLPKGDRAWDGDGLFGNYRVAREVATERDLFSAHGTFYELPANNAGGFGCIRPVATHNRRIHDFCSYRGLLILSGVSGDLATGNAHIIRSDDGRAALWAGVVDDLWKLGKPRGKGGPWLESAVRAGELSDPLLMTGYDRKRLVLRADRDVSITAEVEIAGNGTWVVYETFEVRAGEPLRHEFPEAYSAYWIRFAASLECKVTAQLHYD